MLQAVYRTGSGGQRLGYLGAIMVNAIRQRDGAKGAQIKPYFWVCL